MPTATVTLLAHPERPFDEIVPPEIWAKPWRDHPQVELEVKPTDTLASALQAAGELFNLQPPEEGFGAPIDGAHTRLMFYKSDDETSIAVPRPRPLHELNLVDRNGRVIFGVFDWRTVTFQQLINSADAGTLEGDPFRPYLLVETAYGDAPPIDWPTFKAAVDVAWVVLQSLGTLGGAKWAFDAIRDRLDNGRKTLDDNWTDWSQRSSRPDQFQALFDNRRWRTVEIAKLLDCSDADAAGILGLFGFALGSDGFWTRPGDQNSEFVRVVYEQADYSYRRLYFEWEPTFRARFEEYLRTGEDPGYKDDQEDA